MKNRILIFVATLMLGLVCAAQEREVTKFLGIPVDGTKSEMIQKLKAKGFTPVGHHDALEGEFNGKDVHVFIGTNNRKVYRIMVAEANTVGEADIKIHFNNLVTQFENNPKYESYCDESQRISGEEDISYEMSVNNKRYEAMFYQKSSDALKGTDVDSNRVVWFMIVENYGKYYIAMFYDNKYNQANGEDL